MAERAAVTPSAPAASAVTPFSIGQRWRHLDKSFWVWALAIAVLVFLVVNPLLRLFVVSFQQPDTGAFTNWTNRVIGTFKLDRAGDYTVEVKPVKKPGQAVMDLRAITLQPVAASR